MINSTPSIIPLPQRLDVVPGRHSLEPGTRIVALSSGALPVALQLGHTLGRVTGWAFEVVEGADDLAQPPRPGTICLGLDAPAIAAEDYRLSVAWGGIRLLASTPAGLFYGMQTLLQLLPPAVHDTRHRRDVDWSLPCVEIEDSPRFVWRGAMLDSGRYIQPVAFVKKFIDLLALHKLNVFHWHLTEDQGWRIEIKKHPRLTEVGAWRKESPLGHAAFGHIGDGRPHGGFYTQDEIRDIVAYAAERFVTIVPEIEMPGHAQAALAAYPELGCSGQPLAVSGAWGVHDKLFNVEEGTFRFLEEVMEEVLALFPGKFIHVGGDEAVKTQWEASPRVQARMKELGVTDTHALQSYFIARMGRFLESRGRRLIGWDEILEGGLPAGATVMSWRGIEGGMTAVRAGHDAVMAPQRFTYLDYYQSMDTAREPLAIGGHLSLETAYGYEPVPAEIPPDAAGRILGLQGQVWTEYMPTIDLVEYMTFPRLSALAEVAWSPPARRDYKGFERRLSHFCHRLNFLGVRYRPIDPA